LFHKKPPVTVLLFYSLKYDTSCLKSSACEFNSSFNYFHESLICQEIGAGSDTTRTDFFLRPRNRIRLRDEHISNHNMPTVSTRAWREFESAEKQCYTRGGVQ